MKNLPEDLINTIIMFNNHPCAELLNQAAKDEYNDEDREFDSIRCRVVFTYYGRTVKKARIHISWKSTIILHTY